MAAADDQSEERLYLELLGAVQGMERGGEGEEEEKEGRRNNLLRSTGENKPEYNVNTGPREITTDPPENALEIKSKRMEGKVLKGNPNQTDLSSNGAFELIKKGSDSNGTTRALFSQ